jgi:hypothetical protein
MISCAKEGGRSKAVKFYRDVVGLKTKFESPEWSEFVTGENDFFKLHPASDKNLTGKVELGFTVADVAVFYREMTAKGVLCRTMIGRLVARSTPLPTP